jgi:type IV pilus assembly protein PilM
MTAMIAKPAVFLACEISAGRVTAARGTPNGVESTSARNISADAVAPALTGDNIRRRDEVKTAVSDVLAAVGVRGKDVVLVVPDTVVRIVLLDFETLSEKKEEAEGVIRFRLKKSLPFDVEKAMISYDVRRLAGGVKVVAAVALSEVIQQYEEILREHGLQPGIVLPSTLAALGAVNADKPTLVLKVDSQTTTVSIVDRDQLLLFRTLEGGLNEATGERIAEDVYPSLVFLQDNYGLSVERVLVTGVPRLSEIAPVLEQQTGARVRELLDGQLNSTQGAARAEFAGVVGALLG